MKLQSTWRYATGDWQRLVPMEPPFVQEMARDLFGSHRWVVLDCLVRDMDSGVVVIEKRNVIMREQDTALRSQIQADLLSEAASILTGESP